MNLLLVISCVVSLSNCQPPNSPAGLYAGQPVVLTSATLQDCETRVRKGDQINAANHLSKVPTHSVCVGVEINNTGGFDAPDADGGVSLWLPVIANTDANASAADGPPAGLIPAFVFLNNAQCLAALPKVQPGRSYPVCAKIEVRAAH